MHHAFSYISLPSLHDYDVKIPNFTFWRVREQRTTLSFFFSCTLTQSFSIQLQKNLPTLDELNEMELAWLTLRQREFTFKWRFCSRRRRWYLSTLLTRLDYQPLFGKMSPHSRRKSSLPINISVLQTIHDRRGFVLISILKVESCNVNLTKQLISESLSAQNIS